MQQVLDVLPAPRGADAAPPNGSVVQAVGSFRREDSRGTTQKEILRALLDAGSAHCARIALIRSEGGGGPGWQARGFGDDETVKDFALDLNAGRPPMLIRIV